MSKEILNKYIELIDKGYCDDCNELNCLGNFPHKDIAKNIKVILEENQELKNQQKEFINYLEKEIVDSMVGGIQQYYAKNHLKIYKEIIGSDNK